MSDPILASVLLLIPSLLTNAIGEFNLSPADHLIVCSNMSSNHPIVEWTLFCLVDKSIWNGTYDRHWLNRPLVQPRPRGPQPLHPFTIQSPGENFSTRIVAVQHGSPPEMWAQKPGDRRRAVMPDPPLQAARPTYDPRAPRRPRTPPPIKTTWNQWYITPGEAY